MGDEQLLIKRAANGDRDAMLQLLLDHQQQLGRFVTMKMSRHPRTGTTADDIIQETAFKAFQHAEAMKATSTGEFYSWIKTIAQNLIADVVRRDRTSKRGGGANQINHLKGEFEGRATDLIAELSGDGFTPSQFAARHEAISAMQVAISALPEDQRQAIQLHCFQRRTLQETAELMDRSPASIHGLVQRAKKNLRELMHRSSMWLSRKR